MAHQPLATTALVKAIQNGEADTVKTLIQGGHRADSWYEYQFKKSRKVYCIPLLAYATSLGNPRVLEHLLNSSHRLLDDACTQFGCTAVCWSFAHDQKYSGKPEQLEMAKMLLEAGANVDIKDIFNDNPEELLASALEADTVQSMKNREALYDLLQRFRKKSALSKVPEKAAKSPAPTRAATAALKVGASVTKTAPSGSSSAAAMPSPTGGSKRKRAPETATPTAEPVPSLEAERTKSLLMINKAFADGKMQAEVYAQALASLAQMK